MKYRDSLFSVAGLVVVCCLFVFAGCGDGTCPVAGTVAFNGEPVVKGEISLIATDKNISPDGAVIENGKFALRTKPGSRIVQIRGSRPLPADQQPKDGGLLYEDFIPAQHNSASTLQIEIPAAGKTDFKFDLKS